MTSRELSILFFYCYLVVSNRVNKKKKYLKNYAEANRGKIQKYQAGYRKDNAESIKAANVTWRAAHPESCKAAIRKWVVKNRPKVRAIVKRYRDSHRPEVNALHKRWREKNREAMRVIRRRRENKRRLNPTFRMLQSLKVRMRMAIKGQNKSARTLELLGCSADECRAHLEKQFQPWMTWDNYGVWQIDHIRPCASFDLADPQQQRECFHFSNLQPLHKKENLAKGDKV